MSHQPEAESPRRSRRAQPSVVPYLLILVAAAFLLLFMAYLMQRRTADTVQGVNQAVSSIQSIDQLIEDNRTLHQRVDQLEEEKYDLENQLRAAKERQSQLQSELSIVHARLAELQGEETP